MNKDPRLSTAFGGVARISTVTRNGWIGRFIVRRAAIFAVVLAATLLSGTGRAAAESPLGCTDSAISVSLNPSPSGAVHHGDSICYTVCYGATGTPNPCDVGDFNASLVLPNGVTRLITSAASINAGSFFCCPSADPRCNPLLTAADYCYTVAHADEVSSFVGCPPVETAGIGRVVAYTLGAGESMTPGGDEVAPCATANNAVRHACCEPCTGTCTEVQSATACPFPRVFTPDKHCSEVVCTPLVCLGPVPPCEAGQQCSPITGRCEDLADPPLSTFCETDGDRCTPEHCNGEGACVPNGPPVSCPGPIPPCEAGQVCDPASGQCVNLPDPPLSTFCETDQDLCTPEHCNGEGACVPNGPPVVCLGPIPPCEAGQACDPSTGRCVDRPDPPFSTPCEADNNPCTIDHCDGQGVCTLLRSECDNPDFCDDHNVCTLDICDINVHGCCEYRDIPCPPRPCLRIVGCDPEDGCQYEFDCREGVDCCPDDNNPCTHEFCDPLSGLCRSTPDCTTPDDCNDGLNCTVDICANSCCGHEPLCRDEVEGECFKEAPCSGAEICTRADGCQGACFFTAAGPTRCFASEFGCDQPACTSDADCPAGSACSNTCCGLQCAPLCGNPFPATAAADEGSGGSSSDNTAGGPVAPPICCADGASCDDQNACTDDLCVEGCCEYRPHECPPCHRCDPLLGCIADCRLEDNCCPDDNNPCTHEFCDPSTGLCGSTSDCTTDADCDDLDACTDEACVDGCCQRTPHVCPPRNCFTVDCDSVLGCVYTPDCRAGTDCCPDDNNPCTREFCDPTTGLCGSTSDCTTDADCEQDPPDLCIVDSCVDHCCTALTLCPPPAGACCANDPDVCQDGLACTVDSCDAPGCCNRRPLCPPGVACCADGASCDDGDPCTEDACGADGCCVSRPLCATAADCDDQNDCTADTCGADGCCVNDPLCLTAADCDDENVCTDDSCVDGCCAHTPRECPQRSCFTVVGCDPATGCEYAPVVCEDPNCTACNPATGVCEDDGRCGGICRTPGFWGTHARANPDRARSQNITQAVINVAGGSLLVCGECINATVPVNNAASAVEAMCVSPRSAIVLQNARQLTALALNCVVSGFGPDCSGNAGLAALFDDCNNACTGSVSVRSNARCRDEIDCFNNGGRFDPIAGICTDGGPNNCHDRPLVNADLGLNFEPPGPAGSSDDCNAATGNSCSVLDLVPATGCNSKKANGEACCGTDSCP